MRSNFRTRYNHSRPASPSGGVSMTDPQYLADCKIDTILSNYRAGKPVIPHPVQYGDFADCGDFAAAMQEVSRAKEMFAALPATIRARFGHDVAQFMEYALNANNFDDCVKMGIFEPRPSADNNDNVTSSEASAPDNGGGNASPTT